MRSRMRREYKWKNVHGDEAAGDKIVIADADEAMVTLTNKHRL